MGRLWVLLPCYNEEQALPTVLRQLSGLAETLLRNQGMRVALIIVDDGSIDGTQKAALATLASPSASLMPINIITHEQNMGLGAAIKSGIGLFLAQANDDDVLVTMDADGTHPVETIFLLLEAARSGNEIVIASRFVAGGKEIGLSKQRKFLSRLCSSLMGELLPVRGVHDYSSGFRLYAARTIFSAAQKYGDNFITEMGFACQAEILLKLNRMGVQCAEVPLILRYDLKTGPSKMPLRQTIWRYISLGCREMLRRRPKKYGEG